MEELVANRVNALPPLERACALRGRALLSLDRCAQARTVLTEARAKDPFPWRVDEALGEPAEAFFTQAIAGNRNATAAPRLHYRQYLIRL